MEVENVRPTRSDRVDLWTAIVVGAIVAVGATGFALTRVANIIRNSGVEVLVPFFDTAASLPIGPGGTDVTVEVDQGVLTVSGLPGMVVTSLVAAVVVELVMTLAIVACAGILCWNLMQGRAFSRTNTRLVIGSAIALLAGTALGGFFHTVGINGALATIGDRRYDSIVASGSLVPYFVAIGLAAVALAFRAGERMQRETAGLV